MKSLLRKILISLLIFPTVAVKYKGNIVRIAQNISDKEYVKNILKSKDKKFSEKYRKHRLMRYLVLQSNLMAKIIYFEGIITCLKRGLSLFTVSGLQRELGRYFEAEACDTFVCPDGALSVTRKYSTAPAVFHRTAIFASFSKECNIPEYVIFYLEELKKVVDNIIFVCDNPIFPEELKKIEKLTCCAICGRHGEYDFGSYKRGLFFAEKENLLANSEALILCNDSCYGPIFPFESIFSQMNLGTYDFWGLIDSHEESHHILSFFYVFNRPVFESNIFLNFVHSFTKQKDFFDYVRKYERQFTKILEDAGFRCGSYLNIPANKKQQLIKTSGNGNLTIFPNTLLDMGFPLIKVKVFTGGFGEDLHESPLAVLQNLKIKNPILHNIIKNDAKRRKIVFQDKWQNFEELIENYEVVSFDIFDTLVIRPFLRPTDVFKLMEQLTAIEGFSKKRIQAEAQARKKFSGQADVTLDQIYSVLPCEAARELKELELRLELRLLRPNPAIRALYNAAVTKKKKIVAVSDMYLPESTIRNILKNNGFADIEQIFVSCEKDAGKYDGKLFEIVLSRLGISPKQMIHFGDNIVSDKINPEKMGIKAGYLPALTELFLSNPANSKYAINNTSLAASAVTAMIARYRQRNPEADVFEDLGYTLGGPLAVGYCQFIHEQCKQNGIDTILFVSRDGYALQKVFNTIVKQPIDNFYIYASRALINKTSPENTKSIEYKKFIVGEVLGRNDDISSEEIEIEFEKNHLCIDRYLNQNLEQYHQYISEMHINGKKLACVDMTTARFSSLKFLQKIFGPRMCLGLFSVTFASAKLPYATYSPSVVKFKDIALYELTEELLTAPEFPVESIKNGHPVFNTWNPIERNRIELYKTILSGVLLFAKDFYEQFGESQVIISFDDNLNFISNFLQHCNMSDISILKNLYHTYDSSGVTYKTLYDSFFAGRTAPGS